MKPFVKGKAILPVVGHMPDSCAFRAVPNGRGSGAGRLHSGHWAARAGSNSTSSVRMGASIAVAMSDPLLRELDHYVVLDPWRGESILTAAATLHWLAQQLERLDPLPSDLASLPSHEARAERLLARYEAIMARAAGRSAAAG